MPPLPPHKAARRLTFLDMSPECKMDVLHELCSQFGKVEDIFVPRAVRDAGPDEKIRCYVTFAAVEDAKYCYEALHRGRVRLYNREIRVLHDIPMSKASGLAEGTKRKRAIDLHEVGAKLFIKGVNTEKSLYDITTFFEKFGPLAVPVRMLTDKDGNFKGKLMVSYRDFETADRVIQEMHRAVLFDRLITVEYAEMEDGSGERHGSEKERQNAVLLREERRKYDEQVAAEQQAHNQRLREQALSSTAWAGRQR
jgi:RNA recognition motif-containing protein